jgi:DNA-binding NtrC family response regulator
MSSGTRWQFPVRGTTACIVVVDDDMLIARAVRRVLIGAHPEWHVEVFDDPVEALNAIDERATVIISDLDMPVLTGHALLAHVLAYHPNVVRIVHSARVDECQIAEQSGLCHRALAKPTTSEELIGAVEWSLRLAESFEARSA